jgi:hypothetical protein
MNEVKGRKGAKNAAAAVDDNEFTIRKIAI